MENNWAFLIWIGVASLVCNYAHGERWELVDGKKEYRTTLFWSIVIFLPVAIGASMRGYHEGDTGTYKAMFEECPTVLAQIPGYIMDASRDNGYVLWEIVFKTAFGNNYRLFLTFNALFCSIIIVWVYRKYSSSYVMSIFLFVAGFDYYQWLFNGMRQFMAACIAFGCLDDLVHRRYRKAVVPFIIAASLHMSVLIIVPCLFFVQGKAFNRRTWMFTFGVIFVGLVLAKAGYLNDIIANLMQSTQYDSVLNEFYETMDSGTNTLRVLVYMIPTLLAVFGLRYIRQEDDPVINFAVNMSVISSGIYVISMFTSAIMIGRLPIYFSLYNYILLPWEITHIFTRRSARVITWAMVGFYLLYNYYQVAIAYGQAFTLGFFSL